MKNKMLDGGRIDGSDFSWREVDLEMRKFGLISVAEKINQVYPDNADHFGFELNLGNGFFYNVHCETIRQWDRSGAMPYVSIYLSYQPTGEVIHSNEFYLDPKNWRRDLCLATQNSFCGRVYWVDVAK